MYTEQPLFVLAQRSPLVEDEARYGDLAHIVEQAGDRGHSAVPIRGAEPTGHGFRNPRNSP